MKTITVILLIFFCWYIPGVPGMLLFAKASNGQITNGDIVGACIIGWILGPIWYFFWVLISPNKLNEWGNRAI